MRNFFIILLGLCLLSGSLSAQNTGDVRIYSDTTLVKYFEGGAMQDGKLHLSSKEKYKDLSTNQKQSILKIIALDLGDEGIIVHNGTVKELWMLNAQGDLQLIDTWDMDEPQLQEFMPLALEKSSPSRLFWYAGGAFNGTKGSFSGTVNLRAGTYLYKNLIDCSVTANLGAVSTDTSTDFTGDIGLMGRVYMPIKKKGTPIAPYSGLGVSLNYMQETYVELVFYAGMSIFVGPGSLDIGAQYGIKSKFALTVGYTFRPNWGGKK